MYKSVLNWKYLFAFIAFIVIILSIYFSQQISRRLEISERNNVEVWARSIMNLYNIQGSDENIVEFLFDIVSSNETIPVILTDSSQKVIAIKNIDTVGLENTNSFLKGKIQRYQKIHEPLALELQEGEVSILNYVYYGESNLLIMLRYFPYILLATLLLMLGIIIILLSNEYRSAQSKLWLGMSKETAHQMGTPLSSLQGWIDLMRDESGEQMELDEMQKDINRLNLVVDRFSKIGSKPKLTETNVTRLISDMIDYMRLRASRNVSIDMEFSNDEIVGAVNPQLFSWVIENLIRNALDVLEGKGQIKLNLSETDQYIQLEVADNGKGIPAQNLNKIFQPGFTTKVRGWGIGLSLTKRIIEEFHNGKIYVKHSAPNVGTTFIIKLKKQSTEDIRKDK